MKLINHEKKIRDLNGIMGDIVEISLTKKEVFYCLASIGKTCVLDLDNFKNNNATFGKQLSSINTNDNEQSILYSDFCKVFKKFLEE